MRKLLTILFCLLLFSVNADALSVGASAAVLIDGDSGEVLFSQNADARLPMASTTKIMTALLLCEQGTPEKTITVTPEMLNTEGTSLNLRAGDTVSYRTLLYGMLLQSGNDAADVTAYSLSGGIDSFVELMNKKADELELTNTHFDTPSGLDGATHYTSAYDLAVLTRFAMQNALFYEAASSNTAEIDISGKTLTLTNHNRLLRTYGGCVGVKTGYTMKSGRCLVSAAKREGEYVIAVTLNDRNDWADHKTMLDYGFSKIEKKKEILPGNTFGFPTADAKSDSILLSYPDSEIYISDYDTVIKRFRLPRFIYMPVSDGENVGFADYYVSDILVSSVPVKVENTAEYSACNFYVLLKTYFLRIIKTFGE